MTRRHITLSTLICATLFIANGALAQQVLRAERTWFLKPQVGLSHYFGDHSHDISPFDGSFPWAGGLEFGYQVSTRFSVSGVVDLGSYPKRGSDDVVWTEELLARWTGMAATARVAPFLEFGLNGSEGVDLGLGPVLGVGLDIALSPQAFLQLELKTNFVSPDEAIDEISSDNAFATLDRKPDWDNLSFLGVGLKWNFRKPFTAVDVLSVQCPSEVQVGQSATFTSAVNSNVATPPITFSWNWGEGTSGTGAVATKTFNRPGTYTVTFTASNGGATDTESCTVRVVAPPAPPEIIGIDASETRFDVCEPVEVTFEANVRGTEPITYTWNFGDGETETGNRVDHTYRNPGTYTVRLTARNADGESTRTVTITAEPCTAGICYDITEMNSVFFGRNSSTLTAEGRTALQENLDIFEECPNLCAQIVGYAGPDERNPQELSAARARAVEQFYVDNGIAASRFATEGRGVLPGTTKKEGAAQARRVDTMPVQCTNLNR